MSDKSTKSLLSVEKVTKRFDGLTALEDVSFKVPEGSITGLIGPNGAGKTTLFNVITGFHSPDSGSIHLQNQEVGGKSPHQIAAAGIGRTFQIPKIFDGMTVSENLAFSARNQRGESIFNITFKNAAVVERETEIQSQVDELLEFLELEDLAEDYARSLSGGQRKLLELGRVLMLEPRLIMLDEPVAGVNPTLENRLLERLHDMNNEGQTLLLIEHDIELIMNHCDKVIVLSDGRKLAEGTPSEIQDNEKVLEAYLGGPE